MPLFTVNPEEIVGTHERQAFTQAVLCWMTVFGFAIQASKDFDTSFAASIGCLVQVAGSYLAHYALWQEPRRFLLLLNGRSVAAIIKLGRKRTQIDYPDRRFAPPSWPSISLAFPPLVSQWPRQALVAICFRTRAQSAPGRLVVAASWILGILRSAGCIQARVCWSAPTWILVRFAGEALRDAFIHQQKEYIVRVNQQLSVQHVRCTRIEVSTKHNIDVWKNTNQDPAWMASAPAAAAPPSKWRRDPYGPGIILC